MLALAALNSTLPLAAQVLLALPVVGLSALGIWLLWPPLAALLTAPIRPWLPEGIDLRDLRPAVVQGGACGAAMGWIALVFFL